uniref:Ig-like domain-containing protein n=1 Tax=Latimeria chalumnae TaxID=7897 RepID=H3AKC8_LATCH
IFPSLQFTYNRKICTNNSLGNSVSQDISPLSAIKGSTVTIKCSYSTSYSNFVLPWYRHKPQESLEFLLLKYWDDDGYNLAGDRFSLDLKTNQKSITLTIKDLQLSDSAVYYCELKDSRKRNSSSNAKEKKKK